MIDWHHWLSFPVVVSKWSDDDLFKHFDSVRLAMIDLTADLPDDFFLNKDIEGWLRDDVVEHYSEHEISA